MFVDVSHGADVKPSHLPVAEPLWKLAIFTADMILYYTLASYIILVSFCAVR